MKYSEKFPNMIPIDEVCENIMRGNESKPCVVCGCPTEFIEINYEAHVCSDECVGVLDLESNKAYNKENRDIMFQR